MTITARRLPDADKAGPPTAALIEALALVHHVGPRDWSRVDDDTLVTTVRLLAELRGALAGLRADVADQVDSRDLARRRLRRSSVRMVRMVRAGEVTRPTAVLHGPGVRPGRETQRRGFLSVTVGGDGACLRGRGPAADGALIRAALLRVGADGATGVAGTPATTGPDGAGPDHRRGSGDPTLTSGADVRDAGMRMWESLVLLARNTVGRPRDHLPTTALPEPRTHSGADPTSVGGDDGGAEERE